MKRSSRWFCFRPARKMFWGEKYMRDARATHDRRKMEERDKRPMSGR